MLFMANVGLPYLTITIADLCRFFNIYFLFFSSLPGKLESDVRTNHNRYDDGDLVSATISRLVINAGLEEAAEMNVRDQVYICSATILWVEVVS